MEADPAWQAGINHGHALLAARSVAHRSLLGRPNSADRESVVPSAALLGVELNAEIEY